MSAWRMWAVAAVAAAVVGCDYGNPTPVSDVDISGTVVGPDGQPIKDVNVYFQPASAGAQPAGFKLGADGAFSGKIKSGTYSYFLVAATEGDPKGEAVLKKLPDQYKKADANRTVNAGGKVDLKW